jgi:uncharacterized membrane protein
MDLPSALLPARWLWLGNLGLVVVLGYAVRTAPRARLGTAQQLNVYLGAGVAVMLLWAMRAGIAPGLSLHLLGMTSLALMFGWQLATVAAVFVVMGLSLNGNLGWEAFSLNVLLMGALPAWVTCRLLCWAQRNLPNNFFIYVFVNAFFAAALCALLSALAGAVLLWGAGVYPVERIVHEYIWFLPLVCLPEGLLNGMLVTLLVTVRPHWVWSFDDRRYLAGK